MKPKKSIHLEDDIYLKISRIKLELKEIGIEKTLYQIADLIMRHGIDNAFEIIKKSEDTTNIRSEQNVI